MSRYRLKIEPIFLNFDVDYKYIHGKAIWPIAKKWLTHFASEAKNQLNHPLNLDIIEEVLSIPQYWYLKDGIYFRGNDAIEAFKKYSHNSYYVISVPQGSLFECEGNLPEYNRIQLSPFLMDTTNTEGTALIICPTDFSWTAIFSSRPHEQYFYSDNNSFINS